jgi:hypothetical protein
LDGRGWGYPSLIHIRGHAENGDLTLVLLVPCAKFIKVLANMEQSRAIHILLIELCIIFFMVDTSEGNAAGIQITVFIFYPNTKQCCLRTESRSDNNDVSGRCPKERCVLSSFTVEGELQNGGLGNLWIHRLRGSAGINISNMIRIHNEPPFSYLAVPRIAANSVFIHILRKCTPRIAKTKILRYNAGR